MASLVWQPAFALEGPNGYKVWEDQSFIKWNKRDPHVTLRCHDSVEGQPSFPSSSLFVCLFVFKFRKWGFECISIRG